MAECTAILFEGFLIVAFCIFGGPYRYLRMLDRHAGLGKSAQDNLGEITCYPKLNISLTASAQILRARSVVVAIRQDRDRDRDDEAAA
jgi:hypothetical protein